MTLCDIGNSSYHFLTPSKDFKVSIESELDGIAIDYPLYYISVNQAAETKLLQHYPQSINLKDKFTFNTSYSSNLGIDRAIGCYGFSDAIIVDFGSAITIDIMQNNKHMGGYILPGFEKLKAIYPNISEKLTFNFIDNIDLNTIPTETNSAISFAITTMIVQSIQQTQKQYALPLIITGEHGTYFLHYFQDIITDVHYEKNLLFKNMKLIIETEI